MSEIKKHIGKFRVLTDNTEETKKYITEHGIQDDFDEELYFIGESKKYTTIGGGENTMLVEFIEHRELDEYEDIEYYKKNIDGTIDFAVEYYNGGTCLEECLEEMVGKTNSQ
jgi:uncharacterized protein with von Willebrand factor type A (vWA) domain